MATRSHLRTSRRSSDGSRGRVDSGAVRKVLGMLGIVLVIQGLFALCLISALQLLVPRDMPFGVVGTSPVVSQVMVKSPGALHLSGYASQSAAMQAIDQGQIYGAYVAGSSGDTLVVVPAKSFFGRVDLEGVFAAAAPWASRASSHS